MSEHPNRDSGDALFLVSRRLALVGPLALIFWAWLFGPSLVAIAAPAEKKAEATADASRSARGPSLEAALQSENYLASRRLLEAVVKKSRPKDPAKARDWSRALLALVSLERLAGQDEAARSLFARCDRHCAQVVSASEWLAVRRWGCAKNKRLSPCGIPAR